MRSDDVGPAAEGVWKRTRRGASAKDAELRAESLVGLGCPAIAAQKHGARGARRRSDEGVVDWAAANAELDEAGNQGLVAVAVEGDIRIWEAIGKKVSNERRRDAVRRRQSGQHRVRLQRAMRNQTSTATDGAFCYFMEHMPGGVSRDDNTGVEHNHRRIRSSVSLTISGVSGGNGFAAAPTRP